MNLYPNDFDIICQNVTNLALPIFAIPFNTRLRSEIISSLFEIESAKYFTNVKNATADHEPDLLFLESNTPLEIKVTKNKPYLKWMGNKISKKESQFVLIVWDDLEPNLYSTNKGLKFYITTTYLKPENWASDDPYTYHASFLSYNNIDNKIDLIGSKNKLKEYEVQ